MWLAQRAQQAVQAAANLDLEEKLVGVLCAVLPTASDAFTELLCQLACMQHTSTHSTHRHPVSCAPAHPRAQNCPAVPRSVPRTHPPPSCAHIHHPQHTTTHTQQVKARQGLNEQLNTIASSVLTIEPTHHHHSDSHHDLVADADGLLGMLSPTSSTASSSAAASPPASSPQHGAAERASVSPRQADVLLGGAGGDTHAAAAAAGTTAAVGSAQKRAGSKSSSSGAQAAVVKENAALKARLQVRDREKGSVAREGATRCLPSSLSLHAFVQCGSSSGTVGPSTCQPTHLPTSKHLSPHPLTPSTHTQHTPHVSTGG